jgi:hypothetical protein
LLYTGVILFFLAGFGLVMVLTRFWTGAPVMNPSIVTLAILAVAVIGIAVLWLRDVEVVAELLAATTDAPLEEILRKLRKPFERNARSRLRELS